MLTRLLINNVVLIEKAELDFFGGLTIFSGETGAGKSVLLDSLGLVLGARGETSLIRKGADKLCVTATFELSDLSSPFYRICQENELEVDGEIIIKRTLSLDGKSKILFGDQPISLKLLKELGSYLVEINGQFDNFGLLNSGTHLSMLDCVGGYKEAVEKTAAAYLAYREIQKKLKEADEAYQNAVAEEEMLRHFKEELENMHLQKGEEALLSQRRQEMMNAEKILENFNSAYEALHGQGLASNIRHALSAIDKINKLTGGKYHQIEQSLDSSLVELDEATAEIEAASNSVAYNQNEIDALQERLFALKALARKHNCGVDDLPDVLADITSKLLLIENNGDKKAELERQFQSARQKYLDQAENLHNLRLKAADVLSQKVTSELKFLKMEKAAFRVHFEKLEENAWSSSGFDNASFEVATNAGLSFGPLNKIASGGELSRFMLAIKVNLALNGNIETLVFDEVDAGIGGAAAEAVGSRLLKLAENMQVFAVTHSPQVASFSQTHFKVEKQSRDGVTTTTVHPLSQKEKKEEIARMLSGEIISDEARAAADKLICKSA